MLDFFWFLSSLQKISRAPSDEECFFDLLSKFQSSRMDDQRCPLEECQTEAAAASVPALEEGICKHLGAPVNESNDMSAVLPVLRNLPQVWQ